MAEAVRVIVQFTESEVEMLDRAVEVLNRLPGNRSTRSDVIRIGALRRASAILSVSNNLPQSAQPSDVTEDDR